MLNKDHRCVFCDDKGVVYNYIDGKTVSKPCVCAAGDLVRRWDDAKEIKRLQQELYYQRLQAKKNPVDQEA